MAVRRTIIDQLKGILIVKRGAVNSVYKPSDSVRKSGEQIFVWGAAALLAHIFSLQLCKFPSPLDGIETTHFALNAAGVFAIPMIYFLLRTIIYSAQEVADSEARYTYAECEIYKDKFPAVLSTTDKKLPTAIKEITNSLLNRWETLLRVVNFFAALRVLMEVVFPVIFGSIVLLSCAQSLGALRYSIINW